jgi:hypothetical protein
MLYSTPPRTINILVRIATTNSTIATMKTFFNLIVLNSLLSLGMHALALPQFSSTETSVQSTTTPEDTSTPTPGDIETSSSAIATSTSAVATTDVPSLTEADLAALPLIPVAGDDSVAIVQASNSSLLETHPEIDVEPAIELPDIPEVSHHMFQLDLRPSL